MIVSKSYGKGKAFYLNLSPVEYWDPTRRFSEYGHEWRGIISQILKSAGLKPRVIVYENGNALNMIECLFWKNGEKKYLGIIKNPTDKRELERICQMVCTEGITGKEIRE